MAAGHIAGHMPVGDTVVDMVVVSNSLLRRLAVAGCKVGYYSLGVRGLVL
jgi:hypothetical protein